MPRRRGKPGQVVGLKVEEYRQEEDPGWLAARLAEAFQGMQLAQGDAEGFAASARAERTKAQQMQNVIFQLKERQRNPPEKVSRMDPLASYDLETCEAQLQQHKDQAQELQRRADEYLQQAQVHKTDIDKFQRLLREANAKKRSGT